MDPIPINLAVEDLLSGAVLRKILRESGRFYAVGTCFCRGGYSYLKKNIRGFNNAAKVTPFLVLTDLDRAECPPLLVKDWLPYPKHSNLIIRVAVREVEAWLLAHRDAFAKFVGIQQKLLPLDTDAINDPKRLLISLTSKSKKRQLREAIVPASKSTAKVGPDYNGQLILFVENFWNVNMAMQNSLSLRRAVNEIKKFVPRFASSAMPTMKDYLM